MSKPLASKKINIALKENGLHSLWKGIEAYENAKDGDQWSLKDAIMYVHHGVELLMKQILVQHSEYLLFEDLGASTIKKQKQANAEGTGVFFLEKPPRTVTFMDAVHRVEVFVKPSELDATLISQLEKLNVLRNQIEHYAISIDKDELVRLLADLRRPLITLFESRIGGIRTTEPAPVSRAWESIEAMQETARLAEARVADLVEGFHGQSVPGVLFGVDGTMKLPDFDQVLREYRWREQSRAYEVDVFAKAKDAKWIVDVKVGKKLTPETLLNAKRLAHKLDATPWVAFLWRADAAIRKEAFDNGILLSDKHQLEELERLIGAESNPT